MLLGMFIMFVLIVTGEGALVWFVWRRMAAYLKGNGEAVAALTTHLFVPLLGQKEAGERKEEPKPEASPEPKKIKGARLV